MKRMRIHYSDYVKHMMYCYITRAESLDTVTCNNNKCVENVLNGLSEIEKDILFKIYSYRVTAEGIEKVATDTGMMVETLYGIVRVFEKKVARERGLI